MGLFQPPTPLPPPANLNMCLGSFISKAGSWNPSELGGRGGGGGKVGTTPNWGREAHSTERELRRLDESRHIEPGCQVPAALEALRPGRGGCRRQSSSAAGQTLRLKLQVRLDLWWKFGFETAHAVSVPAAVVSTRSSCIQGASAKSWCSEIY